MLELDPEVSGPYALRELTVTTPEETSPDIERTIKLLVDVAPRFPMLERIDFREGDFERELHRLEAAYPRAEVTYDTAIE